MQLVTKVLFEDINEQNFGLCIYGKEFYPVSIPLRTESVWFCYQHRRLVTAYLYRPKFDLYIPKESGNCIAFVPINTLLIKSTEFLNGNSLLNKTT